MKISIVTISFNQVRFIEQAIQSVLAQDYSDIQYIVVDPGSTDGSRDIIEKYRDSINKVIFEQDDGPADGLNKGFRYAEGQIFGFVNSDDYLLPGTISTIVEIFKKRPDINVLSGHGLIVDENNRINRRIYSHRFTPRMYAYNACILVQPSTFLKAKPFWDVGGFNVENKVNWDAELWVDIALHGGKFARVCQYLSAFRLYPESISGSNLFLNETKKQRQRICKKIGIREPYIFSAKVLRFIYRLSDPRTTFMRVRDEFFFNKDGSTKYI